jgi:hypothetical protein
MRKLKIAGSMGMAMKLQPGAMGIPMLDGCHNLSVHLKLLAGLTYTPPY